MVTIVDAEYSGEIANRLRRVGRYHASRTVVCSVEPGRTTIDARATVASEADPRPGEFSLMRETVVVSVGEQHLPHLARIVDPLVVTDLATVVWSPHGHREASTRSSRRPAARARSRSASCCDSAHEAEEHEKLDRVCDLAAARRRRRPRVAARHAVARAARRALRPAGPARPSCARCRRSPCATAADSLISALLLVGWLCERLGWRTELLTRHDELLRGRARGRRGEVELRLEPVDGMRVPGLAGLEIRSDLGTMFALAARRGRADARAGVERKGEERSWTVLGASRGEPGILGEGIRHALLPDPTFAPALAAARRMLG